MNVYLYMHHISVLDFLSWEKSICSAWADGPWGTISRMPFHFITISSWRAFSSWKQFWVLPMGSVMHGQSFGSVFVRLKHCEKRTHPLQSSWVRIGMQGGRIKRQHKFLRLLALMCHEFEKASGYYIMNDAILWSCFSQYTVLRV